MVPKAGYRHLQNQEALPGDSATPPLGGSCPGPGAPWPLPHPGENVNQTLLMKNAEPNRNNTALRKGTETDMRQRRIYRPASAGLQNQCKDKPLFPFSVHKAREEEAEMQLLSPGCSRKGGHLNTTVPSLRALRTTPSQGGLGPSRPG